MAYGNKESGLYKLKVTDDQYRPVFGNISSHTKEESPKVPYKDFVLLHTRLRHASLSKISHLNAIPSDVLSKFICDSCYMAKFHRVPFPVSNSKATVPFELIHIDLWGPYRKRDTSRAH